MKDLTIKNKTMSIYFEEEIEGTYVVSVIVNDKQFSVNCQTFLDNNYQESYGLSCCNESGGDIYDSGLSVYLKELGIEDCSEEWNEIKSAIEDCAEKNRPENTIERLLFDKEGKEYKHEKSLFGAFGPTDVHHEKYISDDDEIIVTSENTSANKVENGLLGYKWFSDQEDYEKWVDSIPGFYGDCSTSYAAWKDICGIEDNY